MDLWKNVEYCTRIPMHPLAQHSELTQWHLGRRHFVMKGLPTHHASLNFARVTAISILLCLTTFCMNLLDKDAI